MAIKKIKGQNFRAFVNGAAVPEATSCQVSISGNMEDARTKDSEGSYAQEQMTSRGWNVQVDSLDASIVFLVETIAQFNTDSKIPVGWDQTDTTPGTMNRTPSNASFSRSGEAILSNFTITANNRQNITVSRQYQGSGALA